MKLYLYVNNNILYDYLSRKTVIEEVIMSVHNSILLGSRAEEQYRARFQSLYEFTHGAGRMIGPVTMGYFLVNHTYNQGWILVAVLCIIASLILFAAYKTDTKKSHKL